MPILRSQVEHQVAATDSPKDTSVNVVYHNNTTVGGLLPIDYQNHADQVRDAFTGMAAGYSTANVYRSFVVTVKVYDMSDAKPRPIRATSVFTPVPPVVAVDPRCLALCLSFYATRNLPRQRGRIFIGPLETGLFAPTERPASGALNRVITTGHALFDVGGANVSHVVWSPTTSSSHDVTDYWCNDIWDVMHSRNGTELLRVTVHP